MPFLALHVCCHLRWTRTSLQLQQGCKSPVCHVSYLLAPSRYVWYLLAFQITVSAHPEPLSTQWDESLKKIPSSEQKSTFFSISVSQSVEVHPSSQLNKSVTGGRIWPLCAPPSHAIVVCCRHLHDAYTEEDQFHILFCTASFSQAQRVCVCVFFFYFIFQKTTLCKRLEQKLRPCEAL